MKVNIPKTDVSAKLHTKICKTCLVEKDLESGFYKSGHGGCKKCQIERSKAWHREKGSSRIFKDRQLRTRYGITIEDWESLRENQDGGCAICLKKTDDLVIDHDHSCCSDKKACGKCVRGLLCRSCNIGLGMFKDDAEALERAASYLGVKNETSK